MSSPALAAGIFPSLPFSSKAAGTTGAGWLRETLMARSQGMGGAAVAGTEGADALFLNPAGLARLDPASPSELGFGFTALLETTYAGSMAYARPLGPGVLGAGIAYYSQSPQTAYSLVGDSIGSFRPADAMISAAYAGRYNILRWGAALKLIRSNLEDRSAAAAAVDAGIQALHLTELGDGPLDLGLAVSNFGSPLKLGTVADPLPFLIRMGMLWHISPFLNAAFDVNLPVDNDPFANFGAEVHPKWGSEKLWGAFLRAGYNQSYTWNIDQLAGFTAGGGIDNSFARVDYAWVPFGVLGTAHRMSLTLRF